MRRDRHYPDRSCSHSYSMTFRDGEFAHCSACDTFWVWWVKEGYDEGEPVQKAMGWFCIPPDEGIDRFGRSL